MQLLQIFETRKLIIAMLCVVLPALLFYAVSILVLTDAGFKLWQILRDPAQQSGASSFLGFVTTIGIWLWVSSAAICCFSLLSGAARGQSRHTELLASSILVDMKQRKIPFDYYHVQLVEEGCKFIGAALWLYFCGRTAAERLSPEK